MARGPAQSAPKTPGRWQALLWLTQRLSAALILAGIIIHLAAIHAAPGAGLAWRDIMLRLSSPGWRLFEGAFLVAVTWHAASGLWTIVQDHVAGVAPRRLALGLIVALGLELLAVGLYTLASLPWAV